MWRALEAAHAARVDDATAAHRERRADGRDPPGRGLPLPLLQQLPRAPAPLAPRRGRRPAGCRAPPPRDVDALPRGRGRASSSTSPRSSPLAARPCPSCEPAVRHRRPARRSSGCFGLHEWAMVHGIPADDVRHAGWPLRLGSAGTDAVVERHGIRCSHFDAYRFFTDSARPRNALRPTRERPGRDGAARLPARRDGRLQVGVQADARGAERPRRRRCFDLAREIRVLDMRGLALRPARARLRAGADRDRPRARPPTSSAQRAFAERSNALRRSPAFSRRARRPDACGQRGATPARTRP